MSSNNVVQLITSTGLYHVISRNTTLFIVTIVTSSNLTEFEKKMHFVTVINKHITG